MGRKLIVLLLCISCLALVFAGCSPKVTPKDVQKDPSGSIKDGIQKSTDYRAGISYSPMDTAARAAESGTITVGFTAADGSKATYEVSQDLDNRRFHTSYTNNNVGASWQCELNENGLFTFRPGTDASWYGLQLQKDHVAYANMKLCEALNWNGYNVWTEIQDQYGDLVTSVLDGYIDTNSDYETLMDVAAKAVDRATLSEVEGGTVDTQDGQRNTVQVAYDLHEDDGIKIFAALFGFCEESSSDYNTYLDRICRDALTKTGCEFYTTATSDDIFATKLYLARSDLVGFYEESTRDTSLVLQIDEKTGQLVSIVALSTGKYDKGVATVRGCWTLDPTSENKLHESVVVNMDCVNTLSDGFELSMSRDTGGKNSVYSDDTTYSFNDDSGIIHTGTNLSYDKSGGEYELSVTADGLDVTLRGTMVDMQKEFRMTISEVECDAATDGPISVDVSIKAVTDTGVPTANAEYEYFQEMNLEDTRAAYEQFKATMPESVFGEWEPVLQMDEKFYEDFDASYDYNKDGVVDESDKSHYEHIHLILTAPVG